MGKKDKFREEHKEWLLIIIKEADLILTQVGLVGDLYFRYTAAPVGHQVVQTASPNIISRAMSCQASQTSMGERRGSKEVYM